MHRLYYLALLLLSCFICSFVSKPVNALDKNVVISQVQVGYSNASRLIEIYNNSDEPVDITNWCVFHSTNAADDNADKLICFTVSDSSTHLILRARSYALIGSAQLGIDSDFMIDKGLGRTTIGYVYIKDSIGDEVDRLGWGTSDASLITISPDSESNILERKKDEFNKYIDTNISSNDYINSSLRDEYLIGSVDEVIDICRNINEIQVLVPVGYILDLSGDCVSEPIDLCPNLASIQTVIPFGYELDGFGDCKVDVCLNVNGLQLILPVFMDFDEIGNCVEHDECQNILGIQSTLPEGFKKSADGKCILDLLPIRITELLANAVGDDNGNEFIEIYNPNNVSVDLTMYSLVIGVDSVKTYSFPDGSRIEPESYMAFYDKTISFTLVNSESKVSIVTLDGLIVDISDMYSNPKEGDSWSLVDGFWQYSNRITPGYANLSMVLSDNSKIMTSSKLVPCKDGQYRSEETNRCRNIASDAVKFAPCGEGKERNPDTNRCRSVANLTNNDSLKPCAPNQERNPETNRCRNITSNMPTVDYKPEQINGNSDNSILYLSVSGVGLVALGYDIWEWRIEIVKLFRKIRPKVK